MTDTKDTQPLALILAKAAALPDFSPKGCLKCGATLWGDHCDICDSLGEGGMDRNLDGTDPSYGRKYEQD